MTGTGPAGQPRLWQVAGRLLGAHSIVGHNRGGELVCGTCGRVVPCFGNKLGRLGLAAAVSPEPNWWTVAWLRTDFEPP